MKQHRYQVPIAWTGNRGTSTKTYSAYSRDHKILSEGKPAIAASSDPAFRGDPARYNPEELLVAGLSACHMLWYLHLCATNEVVVTDYKDFALGMMQEAPNGSGRFVEVALQPELKTAADSGQKKAISLHEEAHCLCFIANSVNFPVKIEPKIAKRRVEAEQALEGI